MEYVSEEDFYEIKLASILSSADREVISTLYLPLIGPISSALYYFMWTGSERENGHAFNSVSHILSYLQISTNELLRARKRLEAIGLLNTYMKIVEGKRIFALVINAPKQPNEFFNDPILKGLLVKYIGEGEVNRLISSYKSEIRLNDYDEVSAGVKEVFNPDLSDSSFVAISAVPTLKSRKTGQLKIDFDFGVFFRILDEKLQLNSEFFTKDELEYIKQIASVYGVNEAIAVESVVHATNFNASLGERLNYDEYSLRLRDECKYLGHKQKRRLSPENKKRPEGTQYAQLYEAMEEIPASKFLSYRQNNTEPSPSDLALIERLAGQYRLENGVINALLTYVLDTKMNTLSSAYTEKIAASLVREGVTSAVAAVNYLTRSFNASTKKTTSPKKTSKAVASSEEDEEYVPQYRLKDED